MSFCCFGSNALSIHRKWIIIRFDNNKWPKSRMYKTHTRVHGIAASIYCAVTSTRTHKICCFRIENLLFCMRQPTTKINYEKSYLVYAWWRLHQACGAAAHYTSHLSLSRCHTVAQKPNDQYGWLLAKYIGIVAILLHYENKWNSKYFLSQSIFRLGTHTLTRHSRKQTVNCSRHIHANSNSDIIKSSSLHLLLLLLLLHICSFISSVRLFLLLCRCRDYLETNGKQINFRNEETERQTNEHDSAILNVVKTLDVSVYTQQHVSTEFK